MFNQIFCGHVIFVSEGYGAFQHGILYDALDVDIVDGLENIIPVGVQPKIGTDGMAHVMDVELSFDVKVKGLKRHHIFDLWHFSLEGCFVYRQKIVLLYADP